MQNYFKKHNVSINYITPKNILIKFNPFLINDIYINLFTNAVESDATEILIKNEINYSFCYSKIHDNGKPIKEPNKIFNKGYSTKPNHNGFGLYTIKKILNNFNADIYLKPNEKEFVMIFPRIINKETKTITKD